MIADDPMPRPSLSAGLTVTATGDRNVVLTAAGEIDSLTAPDLRAALDGVLADPGSRHLVLDLSLVTFVSSAGLSVLLATRDDAQAREVELRLAGLDANRAVRRPLEITGILGLFEQPG